MFEAAELGHRLNKAEFESKLPALRAQLLNAQFETRNRKSPVIVIVSGADGAGKGELVQRLNEWLDPRGVETYAFWDESDEERERPAYWRFWRAMPARGRIGIFFGSWFTAPIIRRVYGKIKRRRFEAELEQIAAFEKMLVADGAVIVKFWLHLPRKEQRRALERLEQMNRATPTDWKHFRLYKIFRSVSEQAGRATSSREAPWHVIEATDRRFREFTVGSILLKTLKENLKTKPAAKSAPPQKRPAKPADSILDRVDLKQQLTDKEYRKSLETLQACLGKLAWAAREKKRSVVMVFEGWDAAGKGSAIRRVTGAMDPRLYRVVGVAAPTDEERAHHYLWRFWRHLPRAGNMTIFDRSWYGRVLVERVEGFAKPQEWGRAYQEINEFEEQLTGGGIIVAKFWVHIGADEQLRRFKERQTIAHKRYKITEEDWRNRNKWDNYKLAVDEMVARCSTAAAPWTLVAGNDKKFARIQILKTIVERLEESL
jgi:polyphosphate:AMP phosphotransferase